MWNIVTQTFVSMWYVWTIKKHEISTTNILEFQPDFTPAAPTTVAVTPVPTTTAPATSVAATTAATPKGPYGP